MKRMTFLTLFFLCTLVCGAIGAVSASAQTTSLIASAEPDECFEDIGLPYPAGPPCPALPILHKTNQTYMWSLTRAGDSLWGGTGANVLCTTSAAFIGADSGSFDGINVCEFGASQGAQNNPLISDQLGDWRPPQIWEFDLVSHVHTNRTPADPNIQRTVGFRSGGSHNGVAFFAGGSLDNGIIMFAFDTDTGSYLGSREFSQYRTIRKWVVVNDVLYTGAGTPGSSGEILRWTGNKTNPFRFAVVGRVGGVPRELAGFEDGNGRMRLAASARGVFVSPPIVRKGLFRFHADGWTRIWNAGQYEPDLLISTTYGGGAIHWFDGWLWWGTMHVPGRSAFVHSDCLIPFLCSGEPAPEDSSQFFLDTHRRTTIWRARNIGTPQQEVQLVYGETELVAYSPFTSTFELESTGWIPEFGSSGFGNFTNTYSWIMAVANGGAGGAPSLFIGTLDIALLLGDVANAGADLWRIDSATTPAVLHHGNGVTGNRTNYGMRTSAVSADGNKLYLGSANQSNLENSFGLGAP